MSAQDLFQNVDKFNTPDTKGPDFAYVYTPDGTNRFVDAFSLTSHLDQQTLVITSDLVYQEALRTYPKNIHLVITSDLTPSHTPAPPHVAITIQTRENYTMHISENEFTVKDSNNGIVSVSRKDHFGWSELSPSRAYNPLERALLEKWKDWFAFGVQTAILMKDAGFAKHPPYERVK